MRIAVSPLPGLLACEKFAEQVVGSLWWAARFPNHNVSDLPRLRPGHGARSAFFRPIEDDFPEATITLPIRYRTKNVMLHELGHWALLSQPELAYHGPTFARLLLDSVSEFLGLERAEDLRVALGEERVRVSASARIGEDGYFHYGPDRAPSKELNTTEATPSAALNLTSTLPK